MRTIVIRRTGHDLHYPSTRSLEKEGRGVGKWRAIERRSELSDLKLVIGPLLLFAIYIYPFVYRTWRKGFPLAVDETAALLRHRPGVYLAVVVFSI